MKFQLLQLFAISIIQKSRIGRSTVEFKWLAYEQFSPPKRARMSNPQAVEYHGVRTAWESADTGKPSIVSFPEIDKTG